MWEAVNGTCWAGPRVSYLTTQLSSTHDQYFQNIRQYRYFGTSDDMTGDFSDILVIQYHYSITPKYRCGVEFPFDHTSEVGI